MYHIKIKFWKTKNQTKAKDQIRKTKHQIWKTKDQIDPQCVKTCVALNWMQLSRETTFGKSSISRELLGIFEYIVSLQEEEKCDKISQNSTYRYFHFNL